MAALAVVNAHFGNVPAHARCAARAEGGGRHARRLRLPRRRAEPTEQVRERPVAHPAYMHACEIETSFMLHLAPEAVRMDKRASRIIRCFPTISARFAYRWSEFSASPVLGDATAATAEKGRIILDAVLDRMAAIVAELHARGGPAPEPAQR